MKLYRLNKLPDTRDGHFLKGIIPGDFLCMGGMGFKKPGQRSHTNDGPGGSDKHIHDDDREVFIILQGKGFMEIDGSRIAVNTGDVCVVEPGEDHHLISDKADPCVNLWLHAGMSRHKDQEILS